MAVKAGAQEEGCIGGQARSQTISVRWGLAILILMIWIPFNATSARATTLPAAITENTTLTSLGNPYTGGVVTIESGVTLRAEPGVEFNVSGLTVKGAFSANGTAESPIIFKKGSTPGSWQNIKFEAGSSGLLDHVEVRYGGYISSSPAIEINGSSPTITHSVIRDNRWYGIKVSGASSPEIAFNEVINNPSSGISFSSAVGGEVNIHDNIVGGTGASIGVTSTGTAFGRSLGHNTALNGGIIAYEGTDIPTDVSTNIVGETGRLAVSGTVAQSALWTNPGHAISVANNGTLTVASGATLTLAAGVTYEPEKIVVKGSLKSEGTAEAPVVFSRGTKSGSWQNIKFELGSSGLLDHTEVRYAGYINGSSAIEINGASPAVTHSVIRDNRGYGIRISGASSSEIAYNEVTNNPSSGISFSSGVGGEVNIHDNVASGTGATISVTSTGSAVGRSLGNNTALGAGVIAYEGTDIPPNFSTNQVSEAGRLAVSGTILQSATWTDPGHNIVVANNGTLTVAPGSVLNLGPGVVYEPSKIVIKGTLNTEGTAEDPVIFSRGSSAGSWQNIKFEPGSSGLLDHTEVRYAGYINGSSAIEINGASPRIIHSAIRNNRGYGIKVSGASAPEIAHTEARENPTGDINFNSSADGEVNIHDNVAERISVSSTGTALGRSLGHNTLVGSGGISYSGTDIPADITENNVESSSSDDIAVSGTVGHSSTWHVGGSPVRFTEAVVIPSGITLNLQPGVYIRSPKLTVYGTLLAEGTAKRPIALTGRNEEKSGEWTGLAFEPGSGPSLLNYVEVAYGGSSVPMVNVKGVSPTITNSTFRRSSGDAIRVQQSGHPMIEGNRFRSNQFGLRYEGEGKLPAPRDDWGCANGPKPAGCGDTVTANVEWQPAVILQELPRLCPGTTMLATSNTCLLQKYEPTLRLDSEENYLADNSSEITDNWGDTESLWGSGNVGPYTNFLMDGDASEPAAAFLAESAPSKSLGKFRLTWGVLGESYPSGQAADENDWIDEPEEYVRDAHRLEEAGYMDAAYAHVSTDAFGKRWLEYWFWYYYNPKSFEGIGTHEGDWESVLVGLDSNNDPDEVIFSQHSQPANCYIGDVEQNEEGGPVVYVAVDSHANYQKPGSFDAGFVTDYADGAGPSIQPGLVILGDSPPNWVLWPGHWGNTRAGSFPGEADSPDGPKFHSAWSDPAGYADDAAECKRTMEEEFGESVEMRAAESTIDASIVSVELKNRQPQVAYRVPGADGQGFWPRLRISVNELGDGGIPPVSKIISDVKARGRVELPARLKPGHSAEVLGSIVYKNGRRVHLAPRMVHSP